MLDGIFHQRLERKSRKTDLCQVVWNIDLDLQMFAETRLFDLQIGIHMLDLVRQRDDVVGSLQVLAEEG
ncbi:hypothetical protein D3C87_2027750 [compost metagenome]